MHNTPVLRRTKVQIDPSIRGRWPDITVKAFRIDIVDPRAVSHVKRSTAVQIAEHLHEHALTLETVSTHQLVSPWREALAASGVKPSTFKSSPEALVRRYLKSGPLETALPLVNAYCDVSATAVCPLGAYDIGRLPLGAADDAIAIRLRFMAESDSFSPIGGRPGDFPRLPSVPCYTVGDEVVCWGFNVRDSASTCLVPDTVSALFVGEALTLDQHAALDNGIRRLRHDLSIPGILVGEIVTATDAYPEVEPPCQDVFESEGAV